MKKTLLLIACILLLANSLLAINYIKNDNSVTAPNEKGGYLAYHNSSADNLFYGTNNWAVFFDFSKWYTGVDTLLCQIEGVHLYSFQDRENVKISLYEDNARQPGLPIQEKTVSLTQGWNEISFDLINKQKVWVILNDQTADRVNYVCASQGDGSHSFYKSGDAYYNFANNGFKSELLISLKGTLLNFHTDLVINSFTFTDKLSPEARVKPVIQVANNSANLVWNPYITIDYRAPNNQYTLRDSVMFSSIIAPFSTVDISPNLFKDFSLLREPMQYSINANVFTNNMQNEISDNNNFSNTYNVFSEELEYICLENFLQSNISNSNFLWEAQTDLPNKVLRLDYFPDLADLYNQPIFTHKNSWYNNYGYPNTIIQGASKISGYLPNVYADQFEEQLNKYEDEKTFLTVGRVMVDTLANNITLEAILQNENTRIFSSYISNCEIQAFFIQPYQFNEKECMAVSNYLTNMSVGLALTANYGLEQSIDFAIPTDQIVLYNNNSFSDISLVIQVIYKPNKEILFTSVHEMPELNIQTSYNQPQNPIPLAEIWPNPARHSEPLSIKSENTTKIEIYNIKGQKIKTLNNSVNNIYNWNYKDNNNNNLSSGIYFIRISYDNNKYQTKKILLLK